MKKTKRFALAVVTPILLVFGVFQSTQALTETSPKVDEIQSGLDKLASSIPPENPFRHVDGGDFERVLPFSYPPFLNFNVSINKGEEQMFGPGSNIDVKGAISFSNDNNQAELAKLDVRCKEMTKNNAEAQKGICRNYNSLSVNSFEHLNLFVQVWRMDESQSRGEYGDFLVDEFYAKEDFSIKKGQNVPIEINWKRPKDLVGGRYYFSFFINAAKNLPVLSFTPDIFSPLNQFQFDVEGNKQVGVFFDKNSTKINEETYFPVNRIPTVKTVDGKVNVKGVIVNKNSVAADAKVEYKLYRWTQEDEKNILSQNQEVFNVKPGSNQNFEFSFAPYDEESFYTLEVISQTGQEKSVVSIHMIVDGKSKGKFIFIGQAEKESSIFPYLCLRDAAWTGNFKGRVELTASSSDGNVIGKWKKEGYLEPKDGFCLILKGNGFENIKPGQCVSYKGNIYDQNNKLVDQSSIDYNCNNNSNEEVNKVAGSAKTNVAGISNSSSDSTSKLVIILSFLAVMLALGVFLYKKKKKKN